MAKILRWITANPFLTLALLALAAGILGMEPAGFDFDPDPVRTTLRRVFGILGFPYIAAAYIGSSFISDASRVGLVATLLWSTSVGLIPYLVADWIWRRWRRRRAGGPAV